MMSISTVIYFHQISVMQGHDLEVLIQASVPIIARTSTYQCTNLYVISRDGNRAGFCHPDPTLPLKTHPRPRGV